MIYRDTLGKPAPKAVISVFGSSYGQPGTGYLAISAASDAPAKRWKYTSRDVSHIVAEMDAEGWDCTVSTDGYGAPYITCVHRETQAALQAIMAADKQKWATAEKGYIRFGHVPKGGRSYNSRDNVYEEGVSVYPALFAASGECRLLTTPASFGTYSTICDRPAYRVWGEVVGTGSDGEPLLRVSKAVEIGKIIQKEESQ